MKCCNVHQRSYLLNGSTTHENLRLRSFLNFLRPIMEEKLKSFKLASGKELEEELVVEVIEFCEANGVTFPELDQPDAFPVKFKFAQYRRRENQYTKDMKPVLVHMFSSSSSSSNLLPCDRPFRQHTVEEAAAEKVMKKAKYGDDTVEFEFSLSSGMEKLVEEVAKGLNLEKGSFHLTYFDEENDEILLACDEDLQLCSKILKARGQNCIRLFVQLIHK